jgi:signal transduction histidine kinase
MVDLKIPRFNLFQSARLKLTGFYFATLVVFCLLLTFGVRMFTNYELSRGDDAQLGTVHKLFLQYDQSNDENDTYAPPGDRFFAHAQQTQTDVTRRHLNRDFFWIDASLMAVAAVVSYWYAGRTLKPIEEAHEQQKRFTSDASHELRTPLASMRLENEVFLRTKHFTEGEAREQILSNLEEVDRLEKLATNLLALNSYEQRNLPHRPVVVGDVVEEAVSQVRHSKQGKGVVISAELTPAKVDVNQESVVELLSILLDNAIKYGPPKGPVEIAGNLQHERYVITVRDHGKGIAEEDLPHIFERMYRGDKARSSKVSGHGIGLSLASQIASANDAVLQAGNAPDGGAIFTLSLQ